ncbi:hypothetical protein [Faecalibaculum rodentium]|uniref:hypothetical protein n=3 Tax=Faecalibaculum rodentium TaxID=1702221 RepID=UPI00272D5AF7|nr:hypothetical protein [Faecalibaculum rodentium]
MEVKILRVAGIVEATKAMRLPMKSGDKSDSDYCWDRCHDMEEEALCKYCPHAKRENGEFECTACKEYMGIWVMGPKDHDLSMKLIHAGSDHRKHIRLIDVWMEIKAPLYWWKETDTYRFGVDKVSESTMHTLMSKEITINDFECTESSKEELTFSHDCGYYPSWIDTLERMRRVDRFEELNQALPQSYLQTRICKLSYEALRNIYHARKDHKLKEWHLFCETLERLPYSEFITEE